MRKVILAASGVLLLIAGVVLAAFTAIAHSGEPSVIGPAVVVGSAPSSTPSGAATGLEDGVHSVPPSPAVQVTDDHGGGSGGHGS
jgi:predicted ribosomally synthesized peptide with SipW-like signal peptide